MLKPLTIHYRNLVKVGRLLPVLAKGIHLLVKVDRQAYTYAFSYLLEFCQPTGQTKVMEHTNNKKSSQNRRGIAWLMPPANHFLSVHYL